MNLSDIATGGEMLYHGTDLANLPQIEKHGLDPSLSKCAEDEEDNDFDGWGPPYHFVYLSDNPRIALEFSPGGTYNRNTDKSKKVLLGVRLPPEMIKKLVTDRGEFIRAPFVIPPKYITRLT